MVNGVEKGQLEEHDSDKEIEFPDIFVRNADSIRAYEVVLDKNEVPDNSIDETFRVELSEPTVEEIYGRLESDNNQLNNVNFVGNMLRLEFEAVEDDSGGIKNIMYELTQNDSPGIYAGIQEKTVYPKSAEQYACDIDPEIHEPFSP